MPVDAVLLAGQPNIGRLGPVSDSPWEALVPVGRHPMAVWVAQAALGAPSIRRLAVVGPSEILEGVPADRGVVIEPGFAMLENLMRGVDALGATDPVLVITSDIPLVTSAMVETFVQGAQAAGADFVYPIVPKAAVDEVFGESRRTYVSLREGTFTGGNMILIRPQQVKRLATEAASLIALRKKPFALARRLGIGFLLRFLLLRPPLSVIERHFSRLFGLTAKALVVRDAEVGVDIDKPQDLLLCEDLLARRGS